MNHIFVYWIVYLLYFFIFTIILVSCITYKRAITIYSQDSKIHLWFIAYTTLIQSL